MSLPDIDHEMIEGNDTRLIIDESPYQFLPSLAQIYKDGDKALILQQLHFLLRNPHFHGEDLENQWWKGRYWVRIEGWMWCDEAEGIVKHIPQRTFERKKADLEKDGALLSTTELNVDRDDQTRWFTLNYAHLRRRGDEHRERIDEIIRERKEQRARLRAVHGDRKRWRPNIRIPDLEMRENQGLDKPSAKMAEGSRQYGSSRSPKGRNGNRQNGGNDNDKVAGSSNKKQKTNKDLFKDLTTGTASAVAPNGAGRVGKVSTETLSQLTNRLLQYAFDQRIPLTETQAEQLVLTWPAAALSDDELIPAVTRDYKKYGLKPLLAPGPAKKMMNARFEDETGAERLRWLLCVWTGFEESTTAYHIKTEDKWTITQCFCNKFKAGANPPPEWLKGEIEWLKSGRPRLGTVVEERMVEEAWNSLSDEQKGMLDDLVRLELGEEYSGVSLNTTSDTWEQTRFWLLLDPATPEHLMALAKAGAASSADTEDVQRGPQLSPYQPNLDIVVFTLLQDIRGGRLSTEVDAWRRRSGIESEEDWAEVRARVEQALAA